MKANEMFDQQDMEMFAMVNEKTAARRKRREALELACIEQAEPIVDNRVTKLCAFGGATVRMSVGLVVLGGIARGLVDPGFAVAVAAGCALWAWGYWRRNRYGNG